VLRAKVFAPAIGRYWVQSTADMTWHPTDKVREFVEEKRGADLC